jgi:hydroxylamine reductase
MSDMFCYQCEQTANCTGCTVKGICGKDADTSDLQDLLVYMLKGISKLGHYSGLMGQTNGELNRFVASCLFATMTNVNFDKESIKELIYKAEDFREVAKKMYIDGCAATGEEVGQYCEYVTFIPSRDEAELIQQAKKVGIPVRMKEFGEDLTGLQELLTYGLKGMAAYADHAAVLGKEDDSVYAFIYEALTYLAGDKPTVEELFELNMRCGEVNLKVMQMLDEANTGLYGTPEPTDVRINTIKGKCILVSGHDLKDLYNILEQTEGTGINVYTHGEMLPCNAYPELKRFPHLIGNYGGAWQDQKKEFPAFPGPVVMTTNCIQDPKGYADKMFTCSVVEWPGVKHIENYDFSAVVKMALAMDGFKEDEEEKRITIGFAHGAVLGVADKVVEAVKSGDIKHFFFIGGCDGAEAGRNYFTDFADNVPDDCVILTAGCGKYRFNKKEFGDIGGIPRLLDMGQCNDCYSAIKIAVALSEAFDCEVNELPLSLIVSWFEQKAVAILLTLLHLGIKNIRLGPNLPAFITPTVLGVLVEKFNIMPTVDAKDDLKEILGD